MTRGSEATLRSFGLKLQRPDGARAIVESYTRRAKIKIVHKAAAQAWAEGVPWAEALQIADRAIKSADASVPSAKGKGKGKTKGKRKGKG